MSGSVCVCVCLSSLVCMVWVIFVYVMQYMGFMGIFLCLDGCCSMIIWTPTVLSVLIYACVLYVCVRTACDEICGAVARSAGHQVTAGAIQRRPDTWTSTSAPRAHGGCRG